MLMLNKQLTAEQRITKSVVDIMAKDKYVALAGVLMVGSRGVDEDVPTACTNGRDERYGRAFVDGMTDAELRFVVLHENYHKLYRHLTTWEWMFSENAQLANLACDFVVNLKIVEDNMDGFAKMPMKDGKPVGALDYKYRGWDAAAVYHSLRKEAKQGGGSGDSAGQGTGLDEHDWQSAKEMSDEERKSLAREIDEAVRQGALVAGKVGGGGDRDLAELLKTKVDWREALRDFITSTCAGNDYSTWRRPNRRFVSSGYYMPSGITERVGELVIAIDTSGSIGARELGQFLGEVKGISESVKPEAVRLLYWDTGVCGDEKYVGDDVAKIVQSTKPAGGGGTSVECVPAYMAENGIKPQAVVVLTDGYLGGGWGEWSVPVLWCIVNGYRGVADCGKTIHVED